MEGADGLSPGDGSALAAAIGWGVRLLTGQVATMLAVLAVAGLGYTLLGGRIPLRRFGAVLLGCVLTLGAGTIADALLSGTRDAAEDGMRIEVQTPAPVGPPAAGIDPYAFASTPTTTDRVSDPFAR